LKRRGVDSLWVVNTYHPLLGGEDAAAAVRLFAGKIVTVVKGVWHPTKGEGRLVQSRKISEKDPPASGGTTA